MREIASSTIAPTELETAKSGLRPPERNFAKPVTILENAGTKS